ncbi:hypothetical protein BT63DRAFT_396379 [Microthyrium microscopicum]|uniref:RRM domain-containing protein n=1 Tax=Microthyrium microscopicum TaxID=703497 RepID=A0A6A6UK88_9PEZI|nr:hypothetical protein BT63DRAFT_396379 [Microthyrium microscopicum]
MAVTNPATKRKGADVDAKKSKKAKLDKPVKAKKATEPELKAKKPKATEAKTSTLATAPSPAKPARKRAADLLDATEETPDKDAVPTSISKPKRSKKAIKVVEQASEDDSEDLDAADVEKLLATYGESSDSESEEEDDGIALDKLPAVPAATDADKKALEKKKDGHQEDTGTLYIGHLPHGFYEHQMRAYFSQFGTVTQLRLARNRRTGAPKHYAFIEFESGEVADIVARTMNKYLLFGNILQVRRIPQEQIHENLWKGANKRFKKIPWNAIQARGLKMPRERKLWESRITREQVRREKKKALMEKMGYEFDMPELKLVGDVPEKAARGAVEDVDKAEEPRAIEAPVSEKEVAKVEAPEANVSKAEKVTSKGKSSKSKSKKKIKS